jgi:hypothetical protein
MKTNIKQLLISIKIILIITSLGSYSILNAQQMSVSGVITDSESNETVLYATVALYDETGSELISGGVSNMDGEFLIDCSGTGKYLIRISAIGYETKEIIIDTVEGNSLNLGNINLNFTDINIEGVTVIGERIRARTSHDRTTFFVNKKMYDASNTGADIIRLIPGIQMDFRQNISLEGSRNILILVDGKERDRSYLSQLNAAQIDRIEVISNPSVKYDSGVTGVINIILVKDRDQGVDGHVYVELPTSGSELYLFPSYSLNYGRKKLNLYTSYNGELSYFDVHESTTRKIINGQETGETKFPNQILSDQYIRQNTWSHKFHYGFDYFLNEKNQINFYAFYNPWSNEHSGISELQATGDAPEFWMAEKIEKDMNHSSLYSLFYKHKFNETSGHEIDLDVSYHNLNAENTTTFINESTGYNHVNINQPGQNWSSVRIDYSLPISGNLKFNAGLRYKKQEMENGSSEDFRYNDRTMAAYGSFFYSQGNFELQTGMRFKDYTSRLSGRFSKSGTELLPDLAVNYRYSGSQNTRFSYRSAVSFPNLYQLNPYRSVSDPFFSRSGSPDLRPVMRQNFMLEHSLRFMNNYISARMFYNISSDVIGDLIVVQDNNSFEATTYNLGDMHQYGFQLSGALNLTSRVALNPYMRFFEVSSLPNSFAIENNLAKRQEFGWATGFSVVASFKKDITASGLFQYASPLSEIQGRSFHDALYFITVEKAFRHGIKAGLSSAVPFSRSIVYQGSEIISPDFHSYSTGNIKMSAVPVFIKITYQFSAGNKRDRINRTKEEVDNLPRKGF